MLARVARIAVVVVILGLVVTLALAFRRDPHDIGINYQETRENGLAYVQRMGISWTSVADDDGRVALSYGVFGPPETFFIGSDGIIAGRHIGPIDEETLVTAIEKLRGQAATR